MSRRLVPSAMSLAAIEHLSLADDDIARCSPMPHHGARRREQVVVKVDVLMFHAEAPGTARAPEAGPRGRRRMWRRVRVRWP